MEDYSLEKCFEKLQRLAPRAFALWREMLEVNARAYEGLPADSCSVDGHAVAGAFRDFLQPYLSGPVLDIGCGPQAVPLYLSSYPQELVAGLDPLLSSEPHPFRFVQGVAEFLPWDAETFQVVVTATSLDHVLLLDRALQEIYRVLKPTGFFVTWVSFVEGACSYNPYNEDVEPQDCFHMIHFDRPWFERLLNDYFVMEREWAVNAQSTFLCFRRRHWNGKMVEGERK
jgi:SAM-dependent methyltransferase